MNAHPTWQQALVQAAARMDEGHYRGFTLIYQQPVWCFVDENADTHCFPTAAAARRAVDDLIDGDER